MSAILSVAQALYGKLLDTNVRNKRYQLSHS